MCSMSSVCVYVCVSVGATAGSRLCVYMAEVPMTNVVRTSMCTKQTGPFYSPSANMCFQSLETLLLSLSRSLSLSLSLSPDLQCH